MYRQPLEKILTWSFSTSLIKERFLLYKTDDSNVSIDVIISGETIWTTQKSMAELFGVGIPAISKHLFNIFKSKELDKKWLMQNLH